jgi:hypothetical protein
VRERWIAVASSAPTERLGRCFGGATRLHRDPEARRLVGSRAARPPPGCGSRPLVAVTARARRRRRGTLAAQQCRDVRALSRKPAPGAGSGDFVTRPGQRDRQPARTHALTDRSPHAAVTKLRRRPESGTRRAGSRAGSRAATVKPPARSASPARSPNAPPPSAAGRSCPASRPSSPARAPPRRPLPRRRTRRRPVSSAPAPLSRAVTTDWPRALSPQTVGWRSWSRRPGCGRGRTSSAWSTRRSSRRPAATTPRERRCPSASRAALARSRSCTRTQKPGRCGPAKTAAGPQRLSPA